MTSDEEVIRAERRRELVWWSAIALCILAGLAIRLHIGLDRPSLWADEGGWFEKIKNGDLTLTIRAPAYILLHKFLFQGVFSSYNEFKIRIVSIIFGALFLPLFVLVVHRLFRSNTLTLIGALLASFNIAVASYTHEFKPYMLDLFLHTAWFFVAILVQDKRRAAIGGSLVLVVGCLFSYSLVPLLAFQLVYLAYLRAKRRIDNLAVIASLLSVLAYLGFFVHAYIVRFSHMSTAFWGTKYGIFYTGEWDGFKFLGWLFAKVSTYLTYPLNWFRDLPRNERRFGFPEGFGFEESVAIGILFTGMALFQFARQKWDDPRLVPLYLLGGYTLAGVLNIWPLGFFRTNVFLFLYGALAILLMLEFLDALKPMQRTVAVSLVLAPAIFFTTENPVGEKINNIQTRNYFHHICESDDRAALPIVVDPNSKSSINFYLRYDSEVRKSCGSRANLREIREPKDLERELDELSPGKLSVWFLIQGTSRFHRDDIRDKIRQHTKILQNQAVSGMFLMHVTARTANFEAEVP